MEPGISGEVTTIDAPVEKASLLSILGLTLVVVLITAFMAGPVTYLYFIR